MGANRNTSKTNSTTSTNQATTTPGTAYSSALLPNGTALANDVMGQQAFSGDRVAAPDSLDHYVAQWGAAPSTFVPQRTATDAPMQVQQTHVDKNAQEGIDAGMAAANQNQAALQPLVQQGYQRWSDILSGQQNPYLQQILQQLQARHAEGAAATNNQIAYTAGSQGAFGGTDMGRQQAWAAGQQQTALDETTAQLLYNDYNNNQQLVTQAPGQLAGWAGLAALPADQMAHYGGMRQQNLADAAATGDENAQRLQNNLWQAQTLNDQNAVLAAQEAISQWQAAHTIQEAQVADATAGAAVHQQQTQAGFDNAYLNWLNQQETLNNQIQNMGQLISYGGMVPGSTSTGTQNTNSTTTTSQQAAPWQIAAGLGGAALQAFAPGGMFAGSLSALGGGAGAGAASVINGASAGGLPAGFPATPPYQWQPQQGFAYSDERLKKDIHHYGTDYRGIKWFTFRYLWDDKSTLHKGVMASEIPARFVAEDPRGYKLVNYEALSQWRG